MAGIARPFIPWIGSKEKLIPYIWQVFPSNPKLYLEPFGGGGALLLGIQPKISRMDIYMLQLEDSEFDLIKFPQRGVCLYKCGNERYLLEVHAPPYKEALFGKAGGRYFRTGHSDCCNPLLDYVGWGRPQQFRGGSLFLWGDI